VAEREAARRADRLNYRDVLKLLHWTPETFELAKRFDFLVPVSRHYSGPAAGQSVYSKSAIEQWREALTSLAKSL
jgi:hypothetical protein